MDPTRWCEGVPMQPALGAAAAELAASSPTVRRSDADEMRRSDVGEMRRSDVGEDRKVRAHGARAGEGRTPHT